MESTLKECAREGACGWAANNGYLMINTPTLGVTRFEPVGSKAFKGDADAQSSLNNHFEAEMKKVEWVAVKPGPAGKKSRLAFSKVPKPSLPGHLFTHRSMHQCAHLLLPV